MSGQRNRRSSVNVNRARRIRPMRTASPPTSASRTPSSPAADGTALALLFDILVGDSAWTMAEVRRLISMRESAELGRWRVAGLDEDDAGAR
jgi:hypothetical protein